MKINKNTLINNVFLSLIYGLNLFWKWNFSIPKQAKLLRFGEWHLWHLPVPPSSHPQKSAAYYIKNLENNSVLHTLVAWLSLTLAAHPKTFHGTLVEKHWFRDSFYSAFFISHFSCFTVSSINDTIFNFHYWVTVEIKFFFVNCSLKARATIFKNERPDLFPRIANFP